MTQLQLNNNKLADITGIENWNLPNLEILYLHNNEIKSLANMNLPNLILLDISHNQINNIQALKTSYMPNVTNIYMNVNSIMDISPLNNGNLTNLGVVDAEEQQITLDKMDVNKGSKVEINNPIKNLNGNDVKNIIVNKGKYDSKYNNIIWEDIDEENKLQFTFSESLVEDAVIYFNGVVLQPIKVNNMPVIKAEDVILKVGDKFDLLANITVSDKEDGDLTSKIEIIENTVDTTKEGTYKVVYKVTDSQGASATKEIKVTVEQGLDVTPPQLRGISVDKKVVKPGDKVTVSLDIIDDQSGIDYIEIEMGGENSNQLALPEYVYNEKSKKYELTIEIDGTMPNGFYEIFYIAVQDKAGNSISFKTPTDLLGSRFEVTQGIDGYQELIKSVTIDKKNAQTGDAVNISVELANNSYIGILEVVYKNNDKDEAVKLKYNEDNNRYEGKITIDKNTAIGVWSPEYIEFKSNSGKWITNLYAEYYELSDKFEFEVVSDKNELVSGIVYQTHIQDYGWQEWKSNGEMAGTSGESKRLEGIEIKVVKQ